MSFDGIFISFDDAGQWDAQTFNGNAFFQVKAGLDFGTGNDVFVGAVVAVVAKG